MAKWRVRACLYRNDHLYRLYWWWIVTPQGGIYGAEDSFKAAITLAQKLARKE